jgi:hypothetical protein
MRFNPAHTIMAILLGTLFAFPGCKNLDLSPWIPQRQGTYIAPSATVQADQTTVKEIMSAFKEAEEALRLGELDRIMNLYSEGYQHRGFNKESLRRVWRDVLHDYRDLTTMHVFSQISAERQTTPPTAEVTCSGSFWAVSKQSGEPVNIDSWFMEVHYLVYENGRWRIRGHAGEARQEQAVRSHQAPHPFF